MGARTKLNSANVLWAAMMAAFIGFLFQNWWVFWVAFGLFFGLAVYNGSIRPAQPKRN